MGANERELRRMQDLINQRLRISRGERFHMSDDAKETCALCQKRFLGYQVSNADWQASVETHLLDACLCMTCYLNGNKRDYNTKKIIIVFSIFILFVSNVILLWRK